MGSNSLVGRNGVNYQLRASEAYPYGQLSLAYETVKSIHNYLFDSVVDAAALPDTEEPGWVFCRSKIVVDTVMMKN